MVCTRLYRVFSLPGLIGLDHSRESGSRSVPGRVHPGYCPLSQGSKKFPQLNKPINIARRYSVTVNRCDSMKDQIPAFSVCTAVLAMALLVAGCTSSFPVSTTPVTPVSPGVTLGQSSSSCGFTTMSRSRPCLRDKHTPGMHPGIPDWGQVPAVCAVQFRQQRLVLARHIPAVCHCKACVENCAIKSGDDALAASDCEEKC